MELSSTHADMSRPSQWFTIHSPREGGHRLGSSDPTARPNMAFFPFSMDSTSATGAPIRSHYANYYQERPNVSPADFRHVPHSGDSNIPIPIAAGDAAEPSQASPSTPPLRRGISVDANRNMTILLTSRAITNHWLFLVWHLLYNLPQILAVVVVLSRHWSDKLSYYIRENPTQPWRLVTVTGTDACTSPIHLWSVVYAAIRTASMWYHIVKHYKLRRGMSVFDFEMTRTARVHRLVALFDSVWFVLGMIWVLNERTCHTYQYPPYALAFSLMVVSWISMLAPCLLLVCLAPFVFFCAPCVIRLLRLFIEPGEGGLGATEDIIENIKTGKYHPPERTQDSGRAEAGRAAAAPAPTATTDHGSVEGVGRISNDSCPICLVDFADNDELKVLPCSGHHAYHPDCIGEWLRINSICCMCREPINNRTLARERERMGIPEPVQADAGAAGDAGAAARARPVDVEAAA